MREEVEWPCGCHATGDEEGFFVDVWCKEHDPSIDAPSHEDLSDDVSERSEEDD